MKGHSSSTLGSVELNPLRETRAQVVKGYYGEEPPLEETYPVIEGFMISAVLGYYSFMMENEAVHLWIRERMPLFCDSRCVPLLGSESIFLSF
jgi:hypothetical protein